MAEMAIKKVKGSLENSDEEKLELVTVTRIIQTNVI